MVAHGRTVAGSGDELGFEEPGHVPASFQEGRVDLEISVRGRSMGAVRLDSGHVELAKAIVERVEKVVRQCEASVVGPDVRDVETKPGIAPAVEHDSKVGDIAAEALLDIHVLEHRSR